MAFSGQGLARPPVVNYPAPWPSEGGDGTVITSDQVSSVATSSVGESQPDASVDNASKTDEGTKCSLLIYVMSSH
jgi:hypothetical protein